MWWKALLALVVALLLQVGVNYANDYSDGVRGTDDDRVGPLRLVGSKVASPRAVKTAASSRSPAQRPSACPRGDHRLVAGRGRSVVHPRRVVLHRWLAALRLPRPRRGDGVRLLRPGRGARHDVRPDRDVRASPRCTPPSASAPSPAPSWSRTTCATSRPTRSAGSAPWPWPWATSTRHLYGLLIDAAVVALIGVALSTSWWALLALAAGPPTLRALTTVLGEKATGPALVPVLQQTGIAEPSTPPASSPD